MTITQLDDRARVRLAQARPQAGPRTRRADLDLCLEEISPGRCVFTTWIGRASPGADSLLNGGPCATLADFAMAAAVQSTLAPGTAYTIERFAVEVKRADPPPRGLLQACGEVLGGDARSTSVTARVVDARGLVLAEASMLVRLQDRAEG
jgi:acyl-coenzyme A thioesterase PaaI-like protein